MKQVAELIKIYLQSKAELKSLGILRTDRNIEGDYAEWLVAERLNLILSESTIQKGYDATDKNGKTYQIKSRVVDGLNDSTSFDIKEIDFKFDYLLCVFFNPKLEVLQIVKAPYELVCRLGVKNKASFRLRWNKQSSIVLNEYII
ncbi:hypothetical protein G6683_08675 [Polynucleobacter paneuropaeus]|jgi:hypothetical protein|nr:hypothetical protein [Polynucleobacter paneuropaeus]